MSYPAHHAEVQQQPFQAPTSFFIALMALISSFTALSLDIMLPAMLDIGASFNVGNIPLQKVITYFIVGMFFGELLFGPLSDRFGRRPVVIFSSSLFLTGSLVCLFAVSFEWFIIGRVLQGIGAAGPKIVIRALLRDLYAGPHLARIYSLVYTLFIFIPMLAPLMGQGISHISSWKGIFVFLFLFAGSSIALFAVTQVETLAVENRLPLNVSQLVKASGRILSHRKVLMFILVTGIIFGIMLTYLSTAQQIFQQYYQIDGLFPLFFALLATGIGLAFFLNARLVMRFGSVALCKYAINLLVTATLLLMIVTWIGNGVPHFVAFLGSFYLMFFTFGILWGNIGALAMDYLGQVAGIGSTMISAGSSVVAFGIATVVGTFLGPSFMMISTSFFVLALLAYSCFTVALRSKQTHVVLAHE